MNLEIARSNLAVANWAHAEAYADLVAANHDAFILCDNARILKTQADAAMTAAVANKRSAQAAYEAALGSDNG